MTSISYLFFFQSFFIEFFYILNVNINIPVKKIKYIPLHPGKNEKLIEWN